MNPLTFFNSFFFLYIILILFTNISPNVQIFFNLNFTKQKIKKLSNKDIEDSHSNILTFTKLEEVGKN